LVKQFATETPNCPVQFHYGADDASIPPENYEEVHKHNPEAEFYLYEKAGHGFNCNERASYVPGSAAIAWDRTLQFFEAVI
jgi:carboxymethylenebutenolidase